jgi:hypothetical protein
MPDRELLTQARQLADRAAEHASEYSGSLDGLRDSIVQHFGTQGLIAAYVVGAVLLLLIISKLAKISFAALKFLVLPSVVLAVLATFFLGYSFTASLPVTVTACSLFLLFRA